MNPERVTIEIADHVATVTLTRADKHNALDGAMFTAIHEAATELRTTPGVRAVVLHGAGKSFCSGLDFAGFAAGGADVPNLLGREEGELANLAQQVSHDWSRVPVPVIAAIHGHCYGGGLQIALGADIRIAAPDARMSVMEIRWGLIPDMAITQALPRLVSIDVAKELTFTGRVVSGTEADELGLVTRVADDPLAAAQELAAEIATKSPDAIRAGKRLFNEAWNLPAADALALEETLQLTLIGQPNQVAAVTAGMTKQPATYVDPA